MASRGALIIIKVEPARSRSDGQGEALFHSLHGDAWSVRLPSDGGEVLWKKSTTVVRSNCDRGAIEPGSWLFQRRIRATTFSMDGVRLDGIFLRMNTMIDSQSWPNRGAIVARSWRDRGSFEVKLRLIHRQIGADSSQD